MKGAILIQRELTSKEIRELVDEWVAAGNKITICPPGVALNFRGGPMDTGEATSATRTRKLAKSRKNKSKK